ncbi:hypothetical protein SK3146_04787 [Paenibacillus konkukensis]|uniref:Protease PrsW n=1 Tax=Paenibacillus konkukensis TaxID=2020716 RepID=A0ABY4RVD4_9BACL|nr:PrsW family glutamic-type intramembrane protease [Paenibacillus konkukensis]UQZ85498.1 hypothetical protein SK3146_04787 [Paenibacillus konkukensis]
MNTLWAIRCGIRDWIEAVCRTIRALIAKYPFLRTVYTLCSWFSLAAFVVSLIFFRDSRTMLVQYAWSFYVLLQFWFLCRSKTLPWKTAVLFVLSGVFLVVPFTALTIQAMHVVFGGRTSDTWSMSVFTPIFEELWKLLPLGVFLLFSRRASALSLSDYTLIGAATGVGFQLMEELSRRWLNSGLIGRTFGYSTTLLGGETIHWDLFSLFPGRFEESIFPTLMTVSHPVHTAMIALGCGIAYRLRAKWTRWTFLFPALLLAWAILDHAAYNGQYKLPDWIYTIHGWTGDGYKTRPAFLLMLAVSLYADYRLLGKVRDRLPVLPNEPFFNPFSELWNMSFALFRERRKFGYWLSFYRERRELGMNLLYGNEEAAGRRGPVRERVQTVYRALAGVAVILLLAGFTAGWNAYDAGGAGPACFACMFDSLQNWWDRLPWYEQGAILLGALALSLLFVEFWPAVGIAMTAGSIAGSGHTIADYIRDPRKMLTPENALAVAAGIVLSRIPFGRAFQWMGRKGRGYVRKLLDKLGRRKPDIGAPGKPPHHDGPGRGGHSERPDEPRKSDEESPKRDHTDDNRNDDTAPTAGKSYNEVEIVDHRGNPLGEFDEIDLDKGIFYEDKTAKGLDRINPRTGKPSQTPQQFADKQILAKTRVRIQNMLEKAVSTRATAHGSADVPDLQDIKSIRSFVFRLDGDTPELRGAVENSLNQLRQEFPDYTFNVLFGGKP